MRELCSPSHFSRDSACNFDTFERFTRLRMLPMKCTILLFIPLASFVTIGQANAGNSNRIRIEKAATCWALSLLASGKSFDTPTQKTAFIESAMYYSGILNVLRVSQPTLRRTALEVNRLNWNSASSESVNCLNKAVGNLTMLLHKLAPVQHGAPTH